MEELIKKAMKTLEENYSFNVNEITLSDGINTVHLVRNTPTPYIYPPYQPSYQTPFYTWL